MAKRVRRGVVSSSTRERDGALALIAAEELRRQPPTTHRVVRVALDRTLIQAYAAGYAAGSRDK